MSLPLDQRQWPWVPLDNLCRNQAKVAGGRADHVHQFLIGQLAEVLPRNRAGVPRLRRSFPPSGPSLEPEDLCRHGAIFGGAEQKPCNLGVRLGLTEVKLL